MWCIITWKSRFSHEVPKSANLLPYYVEKQVFSWHAKKVQICYIITFRSRFSHDAPKTLIFDALLRGRAGFLMMRQKVQICCLITWKSRFSHNAPQNSYISCIITWKSRFSHDALKRCKFVALSRRKAGFLMTRQNLLYLCIITWKRRFSHDVPKKCKFAALLRGKAGFLMTHQKGANLLHYYVSKQVFSWRAKNSYIWCIITWKGRFSQDASKRCKFVALLRRKAGFLMTRQNLLYLMHYYVERQVFSKRIKKVQICCIIT